MNSVEKKQVECWVYYRNENCRELTEYCCGKWMYFFNNRLFTQEVCEKAVREDIVSVAKHTNANKGVACFYLNFDDVTAHKKVISFFIENDMIRRTKANRYYNISFKLDTETHNGNYSCYGNFEPRIKLGEFIDLKTGEWIMGEDSLYDRLPLQNRLMEITCKSDSAAPIGINIPAAKYIDRAFPCEIKTDVSVRGKSLYFWEGEIPEIVVEHHLFYIIRFRARFYLKNGADAFIKNKTSSLYPIGKPLKTSDIYNDLDGKYYDKYIDFDGNIKRAFPEFSLTCGDFDLFRERYNIVELEIIDGCYLE